MNMEDTLLFEKKAPLRRRVEEAVDAIRRTTSLSPSIGLILGTGLGGLAARIEESVAIPYETIPHFPRSTAPGHTGRLVLGRLGGVAVAAMEGRFHYYEGYTLDQVTFPVRVMKALGASILLVTNACGALSRQFRPGDLGLIEDHINLMGVNPLIGPNEEALGPRFPDMSEPYDLALLEEVEALALELGIRARRAVFVAMSGPSLETRAEYRFLRTIGADLVGMSTVPEVIVAVHAGLRVVGISVVTDLCLPDALRPLKVEDVIAVAQATAPRLERLIVEWLSRRSGKEGR